MTGQDLLDTMEVLNQELQLQSGESDVVRGLRALNIAQDFFEAQMARFPNIAGSGTGTVTATENVETTAFPTGMVRLDRLTLLDANSRPVRDLTPYKKAGVGKWARAGWLWSLGTGMQPATMGEYYVNGRFIFWIPIPNETQTLRWYGLAHADAITASGTFSYDDIVALPLASFACYLLKHGVDDATDDIQGLAQSTFTPVLITLAGIDKSGPDGLTYNYHHTT